ncbi:MAG: BatD family protein, partial [Kiritimatiellae bacterium]|nr:BatD family protein [Kiritimatiellia bacterium]
IVVGGFAALALVMWLLGRGIRALACVAAALLALAAPAQDIFRQMEQEMERMQQRMRQSFGGLGGFGGFHFGEKEAQEPVAIAASLSVSGGEPRVGEPFEFVVSLEAPRTASIDQISMTPSVTFGLSVTGPAQNLPDARSENPSNVVKRLSVPVRYDVPFRGKVSFAIEGMVSGRRSGMGGRVNFTFSNSFRCDTPPVELRIRPLPSAGQPADFAGVVSEGLDVFELPDMLKVETNDVVTITYRVRPKGYVPAGFLPRGAAFEWSRQTDQGGRTREIEYRRYFVADGKETTPVLEIPYYDPRKKAYRTAKAGGTPLKYASPARR